MKTVKDLTELKQLALSRGATVEVGASRYNTTGERVTAFPKKVAAVEKEPMSAEKMAAAAEVKPVAAEPAPPPPATEVKVDLAPVAAAQERLGQMMAQMMSQVSQPVREWEFSLVRNPDGTLASIRARAVQ